MIEFRNASCYYKVKQGYLAAVDEVSLTIPDGELLVIVGESGCGKTTLLRSVLGLCRDTSGEILVDGVPVGQVDMRDNLFAYVSQEYALYPRMSIYENIAYPLRNAQAPHEEVDRRVREIAQRLGLTYLLGRLPRQLSGGQHQRVAIARALIKNPQYILLDEPFSNVGPDLRESLRDMIRTIHREYAATILFVTHDMQEAFSLADRIAVMEEGKLVDVGTPMELRTEAKSELMRNYLKL